MMAAWDFHASEIAGLTLRREIQMAWWAHVRVGQELINEGAGGVGGGDGGSW